MDLLNPGCIDLRNVNFKIEDETDVMNNYKLLEDAFNKNSINKVSFSIVCYVTHHAAPVLHGTGAWNMLKFPFKRKL